MSKVLTICGSLRKGSFNRMLANALPAFAPAGMTIIPSPSIEMPLYNADIQAQGFPALRDRLRRRRARGRRRDRGDAGI